MVVPSGGGEIRDGGGKDCRICAAAGDFWLRMGCGVGQIGGFSHESEHDLAVMVSDFLENGSSGADSRCSSDSDSGLLSDLASLAEKIAYYKHTTDHYERELSAAVRSLVLSISETDLQFVGSGTCSATCIRFSLVKLLRNSGYDAAVCNCKWQKNGKFPGGDHEYIDVVLEHDEESSERYIIDIDFRSHFEIARAVQSYDTLLRSLPVVFVGSLSKLNKFLYVMVDAARASLKQNSMPLPPWRSYGYLQAKWHSTYQRKLSPDEGIVNVNDTTVSDHKQCFARLKMTKSSCQAEIEAERLLKPINNDNNRRLKLERRRHSSFRAF